MLHSNLHLAPPLLLTLCSYVSENPCFSRTFTQGTPVGTRNSLDVGVRVPDHGVFHSQKKGTSVPAHWETDQLVQPLVINSLDVDVRVFLFAGTMTNSFPEPRDRDG